VELAMTESEIQHSIRLGVGSGYGIAIWRNNVGTAIQRDGSHVRYGLCKGSSDLIGIKPLIITETHLGLTIGQFCAVEVKSDRGRLAKEQEAFIRLVNSKGGIAGTARSVEEAKALLGVA
jgi:hypothetical protein